MDAFWKILTENWIDVRLRVVTNLRARFLSSKPAPTEERKLTQRSEKDFCPFLILEWVWELWRPQRFTVWGRPFGLLSGVLLKLRFVSDPQVRYQLQSPLQLNAQARNLVPNRFSPKKGKTNKAAILCAQMIHLVISVQKNTIHSSIHRLVINKLLQPKHEDTIDRQWQLLTA